MAEILSQLWDSKTQIKKPKENPWLEAGLCIRVCFCDMKVTYTPALPGQADNKQGLEACPVTEPPEQGIQQTKDCLIHSPIFQALKNTGKKMQHLLLLQNATDLPDWLQERHKAGSS